MYDHVPTMQLRSTFLSCFNPNGQIHNGHDSKPKFSVARNSASVSRAGNRRGIAGPHGASPAAIVNVAHDTPKRASAAGYYEKRDMPEDAATLRRINDYAAMAIYPYHRKEPLPSGWRSDEATALALASELEQMPGGSVQVYDGAIVDSKSGLTAMVFMHPDDRVYMLCFGGTTSGKAASEKGWARLLPGRNLSITLHQGVADVSAVCGVTPTSYKQAVFLARALQQRLARNPEHQGFALHLTGHSKGGGEAMYAALSVDTPIPATVFAPAHLTAGLIAELRPENLARATELIESYSAKGDPVPTMRAWIPRMEGVGVEHYFRRMPLTTGLNAHVHTDRHFAYFLNAQAAGA